MDDHIYLVLPVAGDLSIRPWQLALWHRFKLQRATVDVEPSVERVTFWWYHLIVLKHMENLFNIKFVLISRISKKIINISVKFFIPLFKGSIGS